METGKLEQNYQDRLVKREPFLQRARRFAEVSIPALLPPQGFSYSATLPEPYSGFGGDAIPSLSSKLLTAILPVGASSFRLGVPSKVVLSQGQSSVPQEVERGLTLAEQLINSEIERRHWRLPTNLGLQLLILTGNSLDRMLPDNSLKVYRLDQYTVMRDATGRVLDVILEEKMSAQAIPAQAKSLLTVGQQRDPRSEVQLYTVWIVHDDDTWTSWQELNNFEVPGSRSKTRIKGPLPVIPNRWALVPGEDYGRGKMEEHWADFRSLEGYEKSMIEGTAMAARHITFVRPNASGGNLRQRIAKANNGAVLAGNPEDVSMLQFSNVGGLEIAANQIERIERRLSAAFLLMSQLRRDAERVTAYELRQLAEELESALGGTYSLLSSEMQAKRIERLIYQMQNKKELPEWPKGMVDVKITTGLEALSREQDVQRVMTAGEVIKQMPGSEEYVKMTNLLTRAFNGLGLPDCVKTEAEVDAERKQQAAIAAAESGMGTALGEAAKAAVAPQE